LFPIFFGISFLIKKREKLMDSKEFKVKIENLIEIVEITKLAVEIENQTPLSTRNQLMSRFLSILNK
jgi:hypothetical protein